MSSIYNKDPPTSGKVILYTSVGELEVELFSKECPKTCRNFLQLCLEGYYDDTLFFRVVPNFVVQGGDPTNSGLGGESVYGEEFKDEFHSRLKFNRRGLLAMANTGRNQNGSQFFFTLDATPELQNKNTLFGKVEGKTVFNVLKIGEGEVVDEKPVYPVKLLRTKVLVNPFDDIQPRFTNTKDKVKSSLPQSSVISKKKKRNLNLLSFEDETTNDSLEAKEQATRGGIKAVHDFQPNNNNNLKAKPLSPPSTSKLETKVETTAPKEPVETKVSKPKKKAKQLEASSAVPANETPEQEFIRLQNEIKALKKKKKPTNINKEKEKETESKLKETVSVEPQPEDPIEAPLLLTTPVPQPEQPLSGYDFLKLQKTKFQTKKQLKKQIKSKSKQEDMILEKISNFQKQLVPLPPVTTTHKPKPKKEVPEIVPPCLLHSLPNCLTCHPDLILPEEDLDMDTWMDHRLTFSKDARVGKDSIEDYKVVDPRNLLSANKNLKSKERF